MSRETLITISGNVVNDVVLRQFDSGSAVLHFRVASNSRRFDKQTQDWIDDSSLYLAVSCWGQLAIRAERALKKGKAIIVTGTLHTVEYVASDGTRRSNLELKASDIGLSLSRQLVLYSDWDTPTNSSTTTVDRRKAKLMTGDAKVSEDDLSIRIEEIIPATQLTDTHTQKVKKP